MNLNRHSLEFYDPRPDTEPDVLPGDWSASFDNAATWQPADVIDGLPKWLVAGPLIAQGAAVAQITKTTYPLLRISDTPEAVVVKGPKITLS
jgi:hypothetical protein